EAGHYKEMKNALTVAQIPRAVDDHDAVVFPRGEPPSELRRLSTSQQVVIPVALDELRNHHRDHPVRVIAFDPFDERQDRMIDVAKGGVDDLETCRRGMTGTLDLGPASP